jgi:hypothetical protein
MRFIDADVVGVEHFYCSANAVQRVGPAISLQRAIRKKCRFDGFIAPNKSAFPPPLSSG